MGCVLACLFSACEAPVEVAPVTRVVPHEGNARTGPILPSWGAVAWHDDRELEALEVRRDFDAEAFGTALADPKRRERALWALGRIGGRAVLPHFQALLEGDSIPSSAELAAIAFLEPPAHEAYGPTSAWAQLETALWSRYAVTEQEAAARALLLAIARVGGARSQQLLAVDLDALPSTALQEARHVAAMEAMGMLCARGHALERAGVAAVATGLGGELALRSGAAYALGRCAGPSAERLAGSERGELVERLTLMLVAHDPNEARMAWKAIGALGELPSSIPTNILGQPAPPWQVEVEAVRTLAGHADGRDVLVERLPTLSAEFLSGERVHVVLEALRGLRDGFVGTPELVERVSGLQAALGGTLQGRTHKAAVLVGCELQVGAAIVSGELDTLERCAQSLPRGLPPGYGKQLAIEALVRIGSVLPREQKATMLLERTQSEDLRVAAAALAALADVDDARIALRLRQALAGPDAGSVAAAAGSIAARASDRSRRDPEAVNVLREAVGRLPNATHVEARMLAIEALGNLARSAAPDPKQAAKQGKEPTPAPAPGWLGQTLLPLARDPAVAVRRAARAALDGQGDLVIAFDEAERHGERLPGPQGGHPEFLSAAAGLRLETPAGVIEIDFAGVPAPMTQRVLTTLAKQGLFDGLNFHRIVPAFVAQGGDPRGDGYGGPGFLIPCERSNLRYERGTVGMALAGKDTGGSQFFIAHGREPRLDARYTIVGNVRRGMDVVDRLLPFDQIVTVEVIEAFDDIVVDRGS